MKLARLAPIALVAVLVLAMGTGAQAAGGSNTTPTAIPGTGSAGPAAPYPSTITVSGAQGTIVDVNATFTDLSHTFPSDIDALLVGPTGATVMLMSDAGGFLDVVDVDLTFDDAAAGSVPFSITASGTFKPTNNGSVDLMPPPAPAGPYGSTLAAFNGTDANGTWKLFVNDDAFIDIGSLKAWSLSIKSCILNEVRAVIGEVLDVILCN